MALTVTFQPAGGKAGPVYLPLPSIVPTVELPPTRSLTVQVTEVSAAPFTCAVNCRSPLIGIVTDVGFMITVTPVAGSESTGTAVIIQTNKPTINPGSGVTRTLILLGQNHRTSPRSTNLEIQANPKWSWVGRDRSCCENLATQPCKSQLQEL